MMPAIALYIDATYPDSVMLRISTGVTVGTINAVFSEIRTTAHFGYLMSHLDIDLIDGDIMRDSYATFAISNARYSNARAHVSPQDAIANSRKLIDCAIEATRSLTIYSTL